jgi:hypothetical protein
VKCAAHPQVDATGTCATCKKAVCSGCTVYEIDGQPCCAACGHAEDEQTRAVGSALLAFVGVGYLAALAIGVVVFSARPFVGGLAAIVAIALGRTLQVVIQPKAVVRR